jgi:hypothetical protein
MDTEPFPPHRGTQEHYLVRDDVWQQAGMPPGTADSDHDLAVVGGGGCLCVGCIEKRLGRLLTIDDFVPITLELLKECQSTPRLLSRVGVAFMAVANDPLPEERVKHWAENVIQRVLEEQPLGKNLVEVDLDLETEEIFLLYKLKARPKNDDDYEAIAYRLGPGSKAFIDSLRRDQITEGKIDFLAYEDEAA